MAKPQGVREALDSLRDLLETENDLDTQAYELRSEARQYTRTDPAYVERILTRLDRIDSERERNRLDIRKLLKEKIEPALDRPSRRTEESIDEIRQALIACMANYAELKRRFDAFEQERADGRSGARLERIK